MTIEVIKGRVVRSKSGRDFNKIYVIEIVLENNRVLVVNGRDRGFENPKLKNIKHLYLYKDVIDIESSEGLSPENRNRILRDLLSLI